METIVVTGSTKGIGRAIGEKFLMNGDYVYFNYARDDQNCKKFQKEVEESYSGKYEIIKNDFGDERKIDEFVETVMQNGRRVDKLILNAGITDRTPWAQMTMEQWNHVININLTVPAFLIQKFAKRMHSGGSILCIGSVLGKYPHSLSIPYGVSKAGVHFLAESLVKEYCDYGITINAICTGFTDTQWQKNKTQEQRNRIQKKIGMKRFAEPEEIARLAFELLNNRYMTGAVVSIDGGYCCR